MLNKRESSADKLMKIRGNQLEEEATQKATNLMKVRGNQLEEEATQKATNLMKVRGNQLEEEATQKATNLMKVRGNQLEEEATQKATNLMKVRGNQLEEEATQKATNLMKVRGNQLEEEATQKGTNLMKVRANQLEKEKSTKKGTNLMKNRGNQLEKEKSTKKGTNLMKNRGNQLEEESTKKGTNLMKNGKDKYKPKQVDVIVEENKSNKQILNEQGKSSDSKRDSNDLDNSKIKGLNEEEKQHNDQANKEKINAVSKNAKKNHRGILLLILLVFIVLGLFWTQKKINDIDYLKKDSTTVDEVEDSTTVDEVEDSTTVDEVEVVTSKVNDVVKGYLRNFAEAVNKNNFQLLTPYIKKDSELYEQQKKYIPTTYERGIREEFIEYEMIEVTYDLDTKTGTVVVEEVYTIIKTVENTKSTKEFVNMYEFELDSATNEILLNKLYLIQ